MSRITDWHLIQTAHNPPLLHQMPNLHAYGKKGGKKPWCIRYTLSTTERKEKSSFQLVSFKSSFLPQSCSCLVLISFVTTGSTSESCTETSIKILSPCSLHKEEVMTGKCVCVFACVLQLAAAIPQFKCINFLTIIPSRVPFSAHSEYPLKCKDKNVPLDT